MNLIEFRPISLDNLDVVIALEVRADQTHLVADNLYSIAQAGLDPSGWCRAAYLDGEPVGFFLVKELESGTRMYLCRFMVDQHHQGKGLGRRIMRQLLDVLFSSPAVEVVDLAVSREAGGAEFFLPEVWVHGDRGGLPWWVADGVTEGGVRGAEGWIGERLRLAAALWYARAVRPAESGGCARASLRNRSPNEVLLNALAISLNFQLWAPTASPSPQSPCSSSQSRRGIPARLQSGWLR